MNYSLNISEKINCVFPIKFFQTISLYSSVEKLSRKQSVIATAMDKNQ